LPLAFGDGLQTRNLLKRGGEPTAHVTTRRRKRRMRHACVLFYFFAICLLLF
jgi:hypothetical protein